MTGKRFRVLCLAPWSAAAQIIGEEEGIDLRAKIKLQVEKVRRIYEQVGQRVGQGEECLGSLHVRFYDGIPYFAYFRTENTLAVGLYYANVEGLQSETFIVAVGDPIYGKMQSHFSALWDRKSGARSYKDNVELCAISGATMRFTNLLAF